MEQVSKSGIWKLLLLCPCFFLASCHSPKPAAREIVDHICRNNRCIPFDIVEKHQTYEVRRYRPGHCLIKRVPKEGLETAITRDMFPKYDINLIENGGTHHFLPVKFNTIRFSRIRLCYLYREGDYPIPSSNALKVKRFPGGTVYVRTFYARSLKDIRKNLRALVKDVGRGRYKSAFSMYGQHNIYEVAITPKNYI